MTVSFFSRVLGYDPKTVKRQPQASRMKVVRNGMLIFLPVGIWFISAFLMVHKLMGHSLYIALGAAFAAAMGVYIVDRHFITYLGKNGMLGVIRIFFALITATLGSIAVEIIVLGDDIENFQLKMSEEIKK